MKKDAIANVQRLAGPEIPQDSSSKELVTSGIPYAEPTWLADGFYSPYFTQNHRRFQGAFRYFILTTVCPDAEVRDSQGISPSKQVWDEYARMNIIAMALGPGAHLHERVLMDGIVTPHEFDEFHELIMAQEGARLHAKGYTFGLGGGINISVPLILRYARPVIRDRVVEEILSGEKFSCLAVTEAFAGSDVAGIRTRAKRSGDGWVVNGSKKWITNGMVATYFVTACKIDNGGIVVLLVERGPGLQTRHIGTVLSASSGTAYVTYDDVFVPYENVLGKDDGSRGLQMILSNFNHERWLMSCASIGAMRLIMVECMKWANQRNVFGAKKRLAGMIARVESCQSWLENVTFQVKMARKNGTGGKLLAGQIAFLKMFASRAAQDTARDAVQIFGESAITKTGTGRLIEHYYSSQLIDAVGGGAEDIIGDLGVRQAMRYMSTSVKL